MLNRLTRNGKRGPDIPDYVPYITPELSPHLTCLPNETTLTNTIILTKSPNITGDTQTIWNQALAQSTVEGCWVNQAGNMLTRWLEKKKDIRIPKEKRRRSSFE